MPHSSKPTRCRVLPLSLCYLIVLHLCLQTVLIKPINADLDFWTKLKLIGLLALGNKISIVPISMPIPVPIHLEGKEEVVFLRSPAPISSAYSYMPPPMLEYSPGPYSHSAKGGGHYSGSKGHSDMVGHASEIVPIMAASSLRYGDRIAPNQVSQQAPAPSPKPIHRQRVNRNRHLGRPRSEYTLPSTTPSPPPAPVPSNEYSYQPPYESEVNKPQIETMKIAIIPMKASELADFTGQSNSQSELPKQSAAQSDSSLPENLLNYIRQVQGLPESLSSASELSKPAGSSELAQPVSESIEQANSDKWRTKENETVLNTSTESPQPAISVEPIAVLTQLRPHQNSFRIEPQHNYPQLTSQNLNSISTPIQSQWQQNMPSPSIVPSRQVQYQPSEYVYKPPELKVIRTRYNLKAQLEQSRSPITPVIVPLQQSNVNQASQSQSVSSPVQPHSPPQQSQFIYSVSHQNYSPPSTSYFSVPSQYPSSDNFGLTAYRQSQQKQSQSSKPSYLSSPLAASASVESSKWIKPEKNNKSKFLNNFGHRISQLF